MRHWVWSLAALLAGVAFVALQCAHAEGVALTFDDLPLNGTLPPTMTRVSIVNDVVRILRTHRVPQVYGFVNAERALGSPDGAEALKRWVEKGERIGNHTYSHSDLSKETVDLFLRDVQENESVLGQLDPGNAWHWFRYPYLHEGDTLEKRQAVRARLQASGYRVAQVTLDFEDYLWNSAYARCVAKDDRQSIAWLRSSYLSVASGYLDADRKMAQLVFGRPIRHVLLLHLGAFSSTILPDLLPLLKQKGFSFITLEEAEEDPAYESDPKGGSMNGGTLLEQWLDARHLPYPPAPEKPYKALVAVCT